MLAAKPSSKYPGVAWHDDAKGRLIGQQIQVDLWDHTELDDRRGYECLGDDETILWRALQDLGDPANGTLIEEELIQTKASKTGKLL